MSEDARREAHAQDVSFGPRTAAVEKNKRKSATGYNPFRRFGQVHFE